MSSSKKRFPPNEWLQRKATIRNMYLTEKRSVNDMVQLLACDDFHPNKHQLEHQLKLWRFNRNIPKTLAEPTWQYVGYEIANRKARGEDTEVVLFGQVQDKRKVEMETRRYYRFRYGGEPAPKPPEGVSILLRSPSCQPSIPWPQSLPWIQFQSRYITSLPLRISPLHNLQEDGDLARNPMLTIASTTNHLSIESSASLSVSNFASLLKTTMPELYLGEAADRARIILQGRSKQALEEQIMIFLFHLSNKASGGDLDWELIIDMIERSGVMSAAMIINDASSTTLLAVREALFQLSFKAILEPRDYKIADIYASMPRILGLIKWLLRSGQPSNIAIVCYGLHVTPLQIAACARSTYLLAALLENGADPNLVLYRPRIEDVSLFLHSAKILGIMFVMPPLFFAACFAHQLGHLGALDLLLSSGATIDCSSSARGGFLSRQTFWTLVAGKKHESIALSIMGMLAIRSVDMPYYRSSNADTAISAASRGNLKMLEFLRDNNFDVTKANEFGLTALHAAAYEGHVKCCKFLLKCGFNADHHGSSFPSPVHLACYRNHIEVVKLLHVQGACIDRELSIPRRLHKLVLKRYFCDHRYFSRERATLVAQLQSPIGAIFAAQRMRRISSEEVNGGPPFTSYADDSPTPLVSYLLYHGVTIPSFAVPYAASLCDTELLSVALAAGADPNYPGPSGHTPLLLALHFEGKYDKYADDQPELENRAKIGMMLLNAGAEATESDAVRAMRLGDWDLVKEILRHTSLDPPKSSNQPDDDMTLLEAALLTGDLCIIQHVLKRDPTSYSPGALCAATLQAVNAVLDPDVVYRLLQYRNPDSTSQKCLMLETTAVGIAACYESPRILELLLTHLPVFNTVHIPPYGDRILYFQHNSVIPMKKAIKQAFSRYKRPFWHSSYSQCSVLICALESNTKIISKLLNYGYRFDWMVVAAMAHLKTEEQYMDIVSSQPVLSHDEIGSNLALSIVICSGDTTRVQPLLQVCKATESGKLRLGYNEGPLQKAIEIGNSEMFDTLLEAGIDPTAPAEEDKGMTALQAAAIYNRVGLAKRLIDLKVDVNAPSATLRGRTALEGAAEHGHIDLIELLLHSGVETTGSGQRQYLRAIGFALRNGHRVAADMLKLHRKLTEEDLSILEEKHLLRQILYFSDSGSDVSFDVDSSSDSEGGSEDGDGDENKDENRDEGDDENHSTNKRAKATESDLTTVRTENIIFRQEGSHQILQTGRDQTLLFCDDETNEHSPDFFSDDIEIGQEPSSVVDITAPSEGIYNFDYPLFGVHEIGDRIGESP